MNDFLRELAVALVAEAIVEIVVGLTAIRSSVDHPSGVPHGGSSSGASVMGWPRYMGLSMTLCALAGATLLSAVPATKLASDTAVGGIGWDTLAMTWILYALSTGVLSYVCWRVLLAILNAYSVAPAAKREQRGAQTLGVGLGSKLALLLLWAGFALVADALGFGGETLEWILFLSLWVGCLADGACFLLIYLTVE